MSNVFFNRQDIEVIHTENKKSEFLISEVFLAIKESLSMESVEEEVIVSNINDIENSSKLLLIM
jgi:hypothetical protein